MDSLFPPLLDPSSLPDRVLCLAPHADDEVFGCGGMLAFHAERGDRIQVLVLSDGAAGDPSAVQSDIQSIRQAEARAAGRCLGVSEYRFVGLPDGRLFDSLPGLVRELETFLLEQEPTLVYCPSLQEMHGDHRAVALALTDALARLPADRPAPLILYYGVNGQVQANVLFDTTARYPKKRAAIDCFVSQLHYHDLQGKAYAVDRARTVNIADRSVETVEGFFAEDAGRVLRYARGVAALLQAVQPTRSGFELLAPQLLPAGADAQERRSWPQATAVISTWNKAKDVLLNLEALERQSHPFAEIIVVDNCSQDDSVRQISARFPSVRVIVMPDASYGACETFNIGFASVRTPLMAILDDDVVLPPDWLEKATRRLVAEPETTAILSTKVVEPEMPESFKNSPEVNRERYMSTFRGCGSLAWVDPLRRAGFYDERLFIYGNERDLTCRLLNLGYRVLQYPGVTTFHSTPFGLQMGKRSLYFHARNAWITQLKYAPLGDLARMPWLVLTRVLLRGKRSELEGKVTDATGTIGIGKSLAKTKGAPWILLRAVWGVLVNVPYCLKHRQPCRSPDFQLPLK